MEATTHVQLLDKAVCVSIHANALWERYESISSSSAPVMGKYLERLVSLVFVKQQDLKKNSELKPAIFL